MLLQKRKHTPDRGTAALKSALRVSAAAAFIGIMSMSAASAGTAVATWDFTLDNAWTSTTPGAPDVMGSNFNLHFVAPSLISWGTPATANGQSSLEVGEVNGHFAGTVATYTNPADFPAALVPTVKVIHNNWPQVSPSVGGSAWLTMATLSDLLTLTPTSPPPHDNMPPGFETFSPPQLNFMVHFRETENSPNLGPMANPDNCTVAGADPGQGCGDIFVLELPPGVTFSGGLLRQKFVFDEFLYEAQVLLEGLHPLSPDECTAAGSDPGCAGLTTQENMMTMFQAHLAIQNLGEIPEPGAVAIFGLGLAGLGFMRRRRKI